MTTSERQLQNIVQSEINNGSRIEYQTADSVTLAKGKRVNNVLHLILSLIIAPWAIVWAIFAFTGGLKRERIYVDESGAVNRSTVSSSEPTWAKVVSLIIVVLWVALLTVTLR